MCTVLFGYNERKNMSVISRLLLVLLPLASAEPGFAESLSKQAALQASSGSSEINTLKNLPGPDGRYDYASFDEATGHLYVARATSVTDYDINNASAPKSIGHIAHGHAVLFLPHSSDLLVTSGEDSTVRFIDRNTGHQTGQITVGTDPDGAVIDTDHDIAYVMNAKSGTVSVIDLSARKVVKTIALKPGLEFPALGKNGTLFVNNEDENEIETIDTRQLTAGSSIALADCSGPSGLAYDAVSDHLISACANGKAALVSAGNRKVIGLLDIGAKPDAVILDAHRRRAYIPCGGNGELDEISLVSTPAVTKRIPTEFGARTGALDGQNGTLYLPTARYLQTAGEKHPPMVAGSFHVLVVNPDEKN